MKRHAVPKKTDERASVKGQRFFVNVDGPMKHSSLGGNSYVVIFVDDCTCFKVVKLVKKKSNTTAALLSLIADDITPQKLSIKCVRTDNGGEFEGEFQRELDRRSITHEHTIEVDRRIRNAWCSFRKYTLELHDRPSASL